MWVAAASASAAWLAVRSASPRWTALGFFFGPLAVLVYRQERDGVRWRRARFFARVPAGPLPEPAYRIRAVLPADRDPAPAGRRISSGAFDLHIRWADPASVRLLRAQAISGVSRVRIGFLAWIGLATGLAVGLATGGPGLLAVAGWLAGALAQPPPAGHLVEAIVPERALEEVEEALLDARALGVLAPEECEEGEIRYAAE